jgi:hypothetical protein
VTVTPTKSTDIVLTFAWEDALEELYASWRREVAAAERVHARIAERLARRHAVLVGLLVAITALVTAAAFSSPRIEPRLVADAGIDRDAVSFGIGAMAALATLLVVVEALGRFASRAETHRIAAIRYRSLEREMATMLATPRTARPQPDRALNGVRERMERYAEESPAVGSHLRRTMGGALEREASARALVPFATTPSRGVAAT